MHLARALDPLLRRRRPGRRSSPSCASVAALGVDALRPAPRRHPAASSSIPQDRAAFADLADGARRARRARLRGLPSGVAPHRLPDRLLGHGHRALPRRARRGHRPAHRPVLDRARDLLADARPRRCRDVHAHGEPAADLLGQLPGQRRGHGLRAAHRAVPGPRPAPVARLDRASWPTAWSCSRRRSSRSRRSPTTCATPRATTRRRAGSGPCATSSGEADLEAFALFADNVRSSCLSADDAPIVGGALGAAAFRLDQGDAARRGRGPGRARGPAARARPRTCCADRSRTGRSSTRSGPGSRRSSSARMPSRGIADLAAEDRLDVDGPSELRPFLIRLRRARVRVFGDVLEMTLSDLTGTMFRPGEVPEAKEESHEQDTAEPSRPRWSRPRCSAVVGGRGRRARAGHDAARRDGLARARPASRVWDDIAAQFEAAHPGVDVEMNYQDDDLYQTIGLPTLLAGPNAPDIYFEWTGSPHGAARRRRLRGRPDRGRDLGAAGRHRRRGRPAGRVGRRQGRAGAAHRGRHQRALVQRAAARRARHHAARRRGRSCWPPATRSTPRVSRPIATGNKDLWAGRQLAQPHRLARRGRGGL